jgi:hypothetical protein
MRKFVSGVCWRVVLPAALICSAATFAQMPASGPDMSMDARAKAETIDALVKVLSDAYVFPDVGAKIATMLEKRRARGEYNSLTSAKEFGDLLTKQMFEIAHDGHLNIWYSSEALRPTPKPREAPKAKLRKTAVGTVEHLSGNIGYMKLNAFPDAGLYGAEVAGAMAILANTDALIIDLRHTAGGSPGMVALLASYLFSGDTPVHLIDIAYRKEGTKEYELRQSWSSPYVPGQRYADKEVYVLTSHRTFSAPEEFAYDLQALKRATVVGETTGGGSNDNEFRPLGDHFLLSIPIGKAVNPVTLTNWEGVGVKPDVETLQADALKTAQRLALQHLIEKTTDERELKSLREALDSL